MKEEREGGREEGKEGRSTQRRREGTNDLKGWEECGPQGVAYVVRGKSHQVQRFDFIADKAGRGGGHNRGGGDVGMGSERERERGRDQGNNEEEGDL